LNAAGAKWQKNTNADGAQIFFPGSRGLALIFLPKPAKSQLIFNRNIAITKGEFRNEVQF
jgi:hypothetical protein